MTVSSILAGLCTHRLPEFVSDISLLEASDSSLIEKALTEAALAITDKRKALYKDMLCTKSNIYD